MKLNSKAKIFLVVIGLLLVSFPVC